MLNKDICKKCINNSEDIQWDWEDEDEQRWLRGWVICVGQPTGVSGIVVNEDPPKDCQYFLEHMMETQETC